LCKVHGTTQKNVKDQRRLKKSDPAQSEEKRERKKKQKTLSMGYSTVAGWETISSGEVVDFTSPFSSRDALKGRLDGMRKD
jgi:hypothetical protein